jgi:cytohesin
MIIQGKKKFNISPKKGIEYLVEKKLLERTTESIASFLLDTEFLDKTAVGEFFGDGNPFNLEVLKEYVKLMNFTGLTFDKALRTFLSGFRLPGEAQKIDRIMEIFASRYTQNNPGLFASPDTAYVLAFSVIMLNTDLHNPAVKNKITKQQFFKNNRGINNGGNLPEAFLSDIYDTIAREEIKMEESNNEAASYTFFSPEREGYLVKQGGRVKTWKKRWFILTGNCLYYFKDQIDTTPCGIIPLENLKVRDLEKNQFELFHEVDTKSAIKAAKTNSDGKIIEGRHSSYLFSCETKDEKQDWMNSIRANMAKPPLYALLQAKKDKVTNKANDDFAN